MEGKLLFFSVYMFNLYACTDNIMERASMLEIFLRILYS